MRIEKRDERVYIFIYIKAKKSQDIFNLRIHGRKLREIEFEAYPRKAGPVGERAGEHKKRGEKRVYLRKEERPERVQPEMRGQNLEF